MDEFTVACAIRVDGPLLCARLEAFSIKEVSMDALRTALGAKLPVELLEMIGAALHSSIIQDQQDLLEVASRCSLKRCSGPGCNCEDRIADLKDMLRDHLTGGEKSKMILSCFGLEPHFVVGSAYLDMFEIPENFQAFLGLPPVKLHLDCLDDRPLWTVTRSHHAELEVQRIDL